MAGNYDLCAGLRLIADAIGRESALRLAGDVLAWDRRGDSIGRRNSIYIPRRLVDKSRLNKLVTPDEAARLVAALGGETLSISNPVTLVRRLRDARITQLAAEGLPTAHIAKTMGVTAQTVRNVISESS